MDIQPVVPASTVVSSQLTQVCSDPAWLQNSIAIEQEFCALVNGGHLITGYAQVIQQVLQDMEISRLLFEELKTWITTWQLGSGSDAAFAVGSELLRSRVEIMGHMQRIHFKSLLVDGSPSPVEKAAIRNRALSLVLELLTHEDLKAIAQAALA